MPWRTKYKKDKSPPQFLPDNNTTAELVGELDAQAIRENEKLYSSRYPIKFSKSEKLAYKTSFKQKMKTTARGYYRRKRRQISRRGRGNYVAYSSAASGGMLAVARPVVSNAVHSFTRTVEGSVLPALIGADNSGILIFSLDKLPNFQEFTTLYLQYKIQRVDVTFTPRGQQLNTGAVAATASVPFLFTAFDPLGTAAVATVAGIEQFPGVYKTPANAIHTRSFRPTPLELTYIDASTNGFGVGRSKWLGTNQPNVPHLGLRYVLTAGNSTASHSFNVSIKYLMSFKSTY